MEQTRPELLSAVDAAWLGMDDRTNWMVNTGALLFDEPLDFGRLKDTLASQLLRFRRFRQRVVRPELPLARIPAIPGGFWETDPLFDLDAHLHHIALPGSGSLPALASLVGNLLGSPLDASSPLWQIYLVENVERGCAVLARLHHCLADGTALLQVLRALTDPAAQPELAQQPLPDWSVGERLLDAFLHPFAGSVGSALQLTEALAHGGVEALFHPEGAIGLALRGAAAATSLKKILLLAPDPQTVLKGELGAAKRAAWSEPVPLGDVKAIGQITGASSHEVLLGAVAGGLRRYLRERGERVLDTPIRAVVPINLRSGEAGGELGNVFGAVLLPLPIDKRTPSRRLAELQTSWGGLRESPDARAALDIVRVLGVVPTEVRGPAIDLLGSKATVVLSSLRGPHAQIILGGKPVRQVVFWVPQAGALGLGLSLFCYAGGVTLGVACDARLVPDPARIVSSFNDEVEEMKSLGHRGREHSRPANEAKTTRRAGKGPKPGRKTAKGGRP